VFKGTLTFNQLSLGSFWFLFFVLEIFSLTYLIKDTLRITGLMSVGALIELGVWHLDVGSNHSTSVTGRLFRRAHPRTIYASWVQNDVNQFGLYLQLIHGFVSTIPQYARTGYWLINTFIFIFIGIRFYK